MKGSSILKSASKHLTQHDQISPKPHEMPLKNATTKHSTIQYTRTMEDVGSVYEARTKYLKKMLFFDQ